MTWNPRILQLVRLSAVTALLLVPAVSRQLCAQSEEPTYQQYWDRVYQDNHVLEIQFTVTRENWDKLSAASRSLRQGQTTQYLPATMVIDGQKLEDVGLRFKGNSSLRSAGNSPRKPFKVDTNRFVKGQKVAGCTKLNLSNVFKDPTYLREKLGYEIFQAAGLPTPGVGWARLSLSVEGLYDNESLGLYVLVEQLNDDFLERRLGEASRDSLLMKPEMFSWQYLGDDPQAYEAYEIKEGGKQDELIGRFASLLRLLNEASEADFAAGVTELVDFDNFASYLAANAVLVNLDSFVGMPHNYYLLVDEADGKLKILPWDLNECFGVFSIGRSAADLAAWDLDTPYVIEHRILQRLFQLDSFRKKYNAAVKQLAASAFTEDALSGRIKILSAVVRPQLAELYGDAGATAHDAAVEGAAPQPGRRTSVGALRPFIVQRVNSINSQLAGETEGIVFQSFRRPAPVVVPVEMSPLQKMWATVAAAEQSGEYDKGIEALQQIVESSGSSDDGYTNLRLAWLHYLKGSYQLAVQHYATAAIALPRALPPRQGLLACYQALGDTVQVITTCQGILLLDPADYQANKTLGDTYYGQANYGAASRYYLQLATLNPNDLAMVTNLGWCYLQLRQLDQAAQVFNNVLAVNPLDASARQGLTRLSQMQRRQAVMRQLLTALDQDQDGELSAEEMAAAPAMLEKLDRDKDGTISPAELQPAVEPPAAPPQP